MKNVDIRVVFLGLILAATLLEVIGDVLFKKWAMHHNLHFLWLGLLIYSLGTVFWALSLRYDYLSRAISILVILNLICVVLIGVYMFKEQLSLVSKIGIGMGILSVILLEIGQT